MKEIDVEMPDGSIQTIEHPDNWTDEQVKAAIYKHFPNVESQKNTKKRIHKMNQDYCAMA